MASEVDIANLALAYLGDTATLSSLNPPEGSAQADHCHRFYPVARDTLLQMHNWNFASKRIALSQVTNPWTNWKYAYGYPSDCLDAVAILPPDAEDDYSTRFVPNDTPYYGLNYSPVIAAGRYVPQSYVMETNDVGQRVIYTNQEDAILRYQSLVYDTTKFSPLFTMTLVWHLASMLAGPILKGESGAAEAKKCAGMMMSYLELAKNEDSNQRNVRPEQIVPWQAGR